MKKRILTLTLAFLLCVSLMPTAALADTDGIPEADELIGSTEAPETESDSIFPAEAQTDAVLTQGNVVIEGPCGENLHYALYNNDVLEITGTGEMTDHPWTDEDFRGAVREVHLPDGLTLLCSNAFVNCFNLQSIDIPDTVTEIGAWAFVNTGLTSLTLPKYLTYLGMRILEGNTEVKELTIPKTLTECGWVNGSGPLSGSCVETLTFESGINTIPAHIAMYDEYLTSVTIPVTVTKIKGSAFQGCIRLESINLPNKITEIDAWAFAESGLKSLTLPKYLTFLGMQVLAGTEGVTELTIPKTLTECGWANGRGSLSESFVETLIFESGIKTVPGRVAYGDEHLTSVTIPDSVQTICTSAFDSCSSLTEITIPAAVEKIEAWAFAGTALKAVFVPDSVKDLSRGVFTGCASLEQVRLPDSLEEWDVNIFENCSALTEITIPEKIDRIWSGTFKGCASLKTIHWNAAITRIENEAFASSGLETVTIPDTVISIGEHAFENCDELTTVVIPNSVEDPHNGIFIDCDALTDVTLGLRFSILRYRTFESCDSLKSIVLPVLMTEIEDDAFKDCTSFSAITIPPSVTTISDTAFSYPEEITVYGVAGSYAETYAKEKGMPFVETQIKEHEHTYTSEILRPATCTEDGKARYTCTECGESHTEEIKATGHDFSDNAQYCRNGCGTENPDYIEPEEPCTHQNTEVRNKKDATCTEDGYTGDTYCKDCGALIAKGSAIQATGHDFSNNAQYCKNGCGTKNPDYVALKTLRADNIKALVPKVRIYNGKPWKLIQVSYNGIELKEGVDYTVTYSDNINAGKATALVKGIGAYTGSVKCTYDISPSVNSITVSPTSKTYKYTTLKKATKTFTLKAKVYGSAKTSFKLSSVPKKAKKYITISSKGKVTVKKGLPKGKYTIKVTVTAAATANYKKTTATKSIKITVK